MATKGLWGLIYVGGAVLAVLLGGVAEKPTHAAFLSPLSFAVLTTIALFLAVLAFCTCLLSLIQHRMKPDGEPGKVNTN